MSDPTQAIIIGGGIAGLTAALCMAESGGGGRSCSSANPSPAAWRARWMSTA